MFRMPMVLYLMFFLILFARFTASLHAEQISHHGMTVEADGSAGDCISCHDGALGNLVSFCTVQCELKKPHSIEKHYPPQGKYSLYAPVASLQAKGIKLVKGKTTCISCHNLRNPKENHLAIDNSGSKLCLACHVKM